MNDFKKSLATDSDQVPRDTYFIGEHRRAKPGWQPDAAIAPIAPRIRSGTSIGAAPRDAEQQRSAVAQITSRCHAYSPKRKVT